jgi:hypothetical protein
MPQNTSAANGSDPAALAQNSGSAVAASIAPVYDPTSGFVLFFDYIVGLLPKHEKITLVFQVRALLIIILLVMVQVNFLVLCNLIWWKTVGGWFYGQNQATGCTC